jgi:hypothetical protein
MLKSLWRVRIRKINQLSHAEYIVAGDIIDGCVLYAELICRIGDVDVGLEDGFVEGVSVVVEVGDETGVRFVDVGFCGERGDECFVVG